MGAAPRRWVFALVGVVVVAALLFRVGLPIRVTTETRTVYEMVDLLDSNDVVMISFDHEASSLPEIGPMATALIDHCFRRGARIIGLALFSEGTAAGYGLLSERANAAGAIEGKDWLYLGFRPQYAAAILGMGESIPQVFENDYQGRPLSATTLGTRVRNYQDIALVISVADGSMPTYWVEYAGSRYGAHVVGALTAVMVTSFLPYLESGQLAGILPGMKGAAEYEQLLGKPGAGTRGMDAQSAAHLLIAILVIIGNIKAWTGRKKTRGANS